MPLSPGEGLSENRFSKCGTGVIDKRRGMRYNGRKNAGMGIWSGSGRFLRQIARK